MRLEARLEWTVSIHAGARMGVLKAFVLFFRAMLVSRTSLAVENLALRQQLAVYKLSVKRPKLRPRDRLFWICLSRLWSNWRSALSLVQPETVIRWHRQESTPDPQLRPSPHTDRRTRNPMAGLRYLVPDNAASRRPASSVLPRCVIVTSDRQMALPLAMCEGGDLFGPPRLRWVSAVELGEQLRKLPTSGMVVESPDEVVARDSSPHSSLSYVQFSR